MNAIMNIKLNIISKNPSIWPVDLAKDGQNRFTCDEGKKMNAPIQHTAPRVERTSSRALASLLLAAGVSALVVLADQLLESWAQRHEIAAWLLLWGIAAAAIVVLRGMTRAAARHTMKALDGWSARMARRRADERLWSIAQTDPRLMADLQAALARSGQAAPTRHTDLAQRRVAHILREGLHYI